MNINFDIPNIIIRLKINGIINLKNNYNKNLFITVEINHIINNIKYKCYF